jgi:hypothetical protein
VKSATFENAFVVMRGAQDEQSYSIFVAPQYIEEFSLQDLGI